MLSYCPTALESTPYYVTSSLPPKFESEFKSEFGCLGYGSHWERSSTSKVHLCVLTENNGLYTIHGKGRQRKETGRKAIARSYHIAPLSFNSLTANRFQGCIADAKAMVHAKAMVCAASETWEVVDYFSRAILICHGEANLWAGRM